MGILKNHGGGKGRKGKGFQQPSPKIPTPIPTAPSRAEPKKPSFSNLSLYTEYLMLPPPRSLQQLAMKHGLPVAPIEWYQLAEAEAWAIAAQTFDDAKSEARVGSNWEAAEETQRDVLQVTKDLLADVKSHRISGDFEAAELTKSLMTTVKGITAVRLQVLEGLERPESNSAVDTPKVVAKAPEQMDIRALNMLMWGTPLDPYEWKKLQED